jgi:hypothetical protein
LPGQIFVILDSAFFAALYGLNLTPSTYLVVTVDVTVSL